MMTRPSATMSCKVRLWSGGKETRGTSSVGGDFCSPWSICAFGVDGTTSCARCCGFCPDGEGSCHAPHCHEHGPSLPSLRCSTLLCSATSGHTAGMQWRLHAPRLMGAALNSSCGENEYFKVRRETTGQHTTQAQSPASGETAWEFRSRLKWPGARTTEAARATVSGARLILSRCCEKRDARFLKRDARSRVLNCRA